MVIEPPDVLASTRPPASLMLIEPPDVLAPSLSATRYCVGDVDRDGDVDVVGGIDLGSETDLMLVENFR